MAAGTHHLTQDNAICAWATYFREYEVVDQNGDPVDLTLVDPDSTVGAVGLRMQIRSTADAEDGSAFGDPLVDLSDDATAATGDSWIVIIAPATAGIFQVSMSWQDTGGLQSDTSSPFGARPSGGALSFPLVYDIIGVGAGTPRYRLKLFGGDVAIEKGVTKVAD